MMNREEFVREMEGLLEVEPGTLTGRENIVDIEGWNSLAIISFMAFADERFGVTLLPKGILCCKTIDDLFDLAARNAVGV